MTAFTITRTFNAPRPLVFDCWTKEEHIIKWLAPAGAKNEIISSDIRPGGFNHSCITMPDGTKLYGKYTFKEISPVERLVYINAFADADANLIHHPMAPDWPLELLTTVLFKELGNKTELTLTWVPIDASEIEEACFEQGLESCKAGWGGSFDSLDRYLASR